MSPHLDASPWPQELPLPSGSAVYDLIYNPLETALLRSARRAGLPAFSGLGMLAEQAALAFERWTGLAAPREALRRAVDLFEFPE
jgi:shikimate dehydrogenase